MLTNSKWRRTLQNVQRVPVQPHMLSYREVDFLECAGEGCTLPPSYVTNEFVLASHALSNHNLFSTPALFNATSRPLFSPRPYPILFISSVCVCVCVFKLKDRSIFQLHHSVSNSVVNMSVCVCVCVSVLSWGGILLHNLNSSQMKKIAKSIWIQPVEQLDRIERACVCVPMCVCARACMCVHLRSTPLPSVVILQHFADASRGQKHE